MRRAFAAERVSYPFVYTGRVTGDQTESGIGKRRTDHPCDPAFCRTGPSGADNENEPFQ
jgi:hypothetical protein